MSLSSSEYSGSVSNWLNLSSSDNVSGSRGSLTHSSSVGSPVTTSSKKEETEGLRHHRAQKQKSLGIAIQIPAFQAH